MLIGAVEHVEEEARGEECAEIPSRSSPGRASDNPVTVEGDSRLVTRSRAECGTQGCEGAWDHHDPEGSTQNLVADTSSGCFVWAIGPMYAPPNSSTKDGRR